MIERLDEFVREWEKAKLKINVEWAKIMRFWNKELTGDIVVAPYYTFEQVEFRYFGCMITNDEETKT